MNTYISIGDIVDIYYLLRNRGIGFLLSKLGTSHSRVKGTWNNILESRNKYWWEIPFVRGRMNLLKTGNSQTETSDYVFQKYIKEKNNLIMLSPGCGTGGKELKYGAFPQIKRIDAFDIASKRILIAKEEAESAGIKNINFFIADISEYDFGIDKYDIIIFDSFLHHVEDISAILKKVKSALKPGGILIIDEYVGPNRFQWTERQLAKANEALHKIPEDLRRRVSGNIKKKIYKPGLLRMILSDPSEAVNSESIVKELESVFTPVNVHPYGGNIIQLVLKDIAHNFFSDSDRVTSTLDKLFEFEDEFLKTEKSDFLFGIYKKRMN